MMCWANTRTLKALSETGHGESVLIADGNCGVTNFGRSYIRVDGVRAPDLLRAILEVYPLDETEYPSSVCDWAGPRPPIWAEFEDIIRSSEEAEKLQNGIQVLCEKDFLKALESTAWILATSEPALAANLLLVKGIVRSDCGGA